MVMMYNSQVWTRTALVERWGKDAHVALRREIDTRNREHGGRRGVIQQRIKAKKKVRATIERNCYTPTFTPRTPIPWGWGLSFGEEVW